MSVLGILFYMVKRTTHNTNSNQTHVCIYDIAVSDSMDAIVK